MDISKLPWAFLFLGITAILCFISWKVIGWTFKKYIPKPTPKIHQNELNINTRSLIEMKKLLDEKLITQEEFDEFKKKQLDQLKAS